MMSSLKLTSPMQAGIVQDWDLMNQMWEYCFREKFAVDPSEHKVFITEPILTSKADTEKMA